MAAKISNHLTPQQITMANIIIAIADKHQIAYDIDPENLYFNFHAKTQQQSDDLMMELCDTLEEL
jgi:hypothetical protein